MIEVTSRREEDDLSALLFSLMMQQSSLAPEVPVASLSGVFFSPRSSSNSWTTIVL